MIMTAARIDLDTAEMPTLRIGLKWDAAAGDVLKDAFGFGSQLTVKAKLGAAKLRLAVLDPICKVTGAMRQQHSRLARQIAAMEGYLEHGGLPSSDLDLYCYCYDASGQLLALIAPNTEDSRGATGIKAWIVHSGDEKTGVSAGFDEEILIDLAELDDTVAQIVIVAMCATGTFRQIQGGKCAAVNPETREFLAACDLASRDEQAFVFAQLRHAGPGWQLLSIGEYCQTPGGDAADDAMDGILRAQYVARAA